MLLSEGPVTTLKIAAILDLNENLFMLIVLTFSLRHRRNRPFPSSLQPLNQNEVKC